MPLEPISTPRSRAFRADPHHHDDPTLKRLRALVLPDDVVLDIGAGCYALPLALVCREVIALDPCAGVRQVLTESLAENGIANVRVVDGRWPGDASGLKADVALVSHTGYDVEDFGPFFDAMESAARRLCVAVLLSQPPPTEADRFWSAVHGVPRATLPSLPELLNLLLARGRLFEVQLVDRSPQTFADSKEVLALLRQRLWTAPDSDKDCRMESVAHQRLKERNGQYAVSWDPVAGCVVTWSPR